MVFYAETYFSLVFCLFSINSFKAEEWKAIDVLAFWISSFKGVKYSLCLSIIPNETGFYFLCPLINYKVENKRDIADCKIEIVFYFSCCFNFFTFLFSFVVSTLFLVFQFFLVVSYFLSFLSLSLVVSTFLSAFTSSFLSQGRS